MFCMNCGREINDNAVFCPHCGVRLKPMSTSNSASDENSLAIVGFVFSFFIAIVGLICSIIGYRKSVNEGAPNKGLALAGIAISIVSMALGFIITVVYCVAFAAVLA